MQLYVQSAGVAPPLRRNAANRRGIVSALLLLPMIAVICLTRPMMAPGAIVGMVATFLAWLLLALGIGLRLWATLYIGGRKDHELVTGGPYALCRHPLYVGSFLVVFSLGFFVASLAGCVCIISLAFVYSIVLVPAEEQASLALFGGAYRKYAESTARFVPRRLSIDRPGTVNVKVAALLREMVRAYGLIALGAIAQTLAVCRHQSWWPALFPLP